MVLVGIGPEENAHEWKKSNEFPFKLVLDPDAELYSELGLKRSARALWNIDVLVEFAEQMVAGTFKIVHFEGDETFTVAGDYITDSSGKVLLASNQQKITDRPSVKEILDVLDTAA